MKKLLFLVLLAATTVIAYADKNHKATVTKQGVKLKQQQPVKPADIAGHMEYGQREIDSSIGRKMYFASAQTAKQ